ncbi:hypothetical protein HanPSC8_Chr15g0675291 [Helianthus annuus]|nr:hypothetical protein HanPSC8_Chr15g0675291 [Helianthus annuus]
MNIFLLFLFFLVSATALNGRNFCFLYISRICDRFIRSQLLFFLFAIALNGRNFCYFFIFLVFATVFRPQKYGHKICDCFAIESRLVFNFAIVLVLVTNRSLILRPSYVSRKIWSQLPSFLVVRSLATHFMLAMEEGSAMSIFDAVVINEGSRDELLAIANLAMRCLNLNGRNRPTMKEVANELETIRTSHIASTAQTSMEL